jgi:GcrA cell cycle regulator
MEGAQMNPWTPEREEALRTLWMTGISAARIARRMGNTTRNAVIGKAVRLGLAPHAKATKTAHHAKATKTAHRKRQKRPPAIKPTSVRPTKALLQSLPSEPIPDQPDVPDVLFKWLDWDETACRWPYTKDEDQFYGCKCEKLPGLPYCAGHAARAFKPAKIDPRKVTHHKSPEFA